MNLSPADSAGSLADLQSILTKNAPSFVADSTALQVPDFPDTPSPHLSSSLQWLGCLYWGSPSPQQAAVPAPAPASSGPGWALDLSSGNPAWLAALVPAVESSFSRDADMQLCAGIPAGLEPQDHSSSSGGNGGSSSMGHARCQGCLWPQERPPGVQTSALRPCAGDPSRPPRLQIGAAREVDASSSSSSSSSSSRICKTNNQPCQQVACTHGNPADDSSSSSSSGGAGSACRPPAPSSLVNWPRQPRLLDWLQRGPPAVPAAAVAVAVEAAPQGQEDAVTTSSSSSSRGAMGRKCTAHAGVTPHQCHPGTPVVNNRPPWLLPPPPAEPAPTAAPAPPIMVMPLHSITSIEAAMRRRGCCAALLAGPLQVALAVSWALLQLPLVGAAASTLVWRWAGLEVLPPDGPPQEDSCRSSSALAAVGAALAGERLVRRARCWGPTPGGAWPQQVAVAGAGVGSGSGQPGCGG